MSKNSDLQALAIAEDPSSKATDLARALEIGDTENEELLLLLLKHPAVTERVSKAVIAAAFQTKGLRVFDRHDGGALGPAYSKMSGSLAVALAGNPFISPRATVHFSRCASSEIALALASNPVCPPDELLCLLSMGRLRGVESVLKELESAIAARSPAGKWENLEGAREWLAAMDVKTAPSDLATLAAHPYKSIRNQLAYNPSTPVASLRSLYEEQSGDDSFDVSLRRLPMLNRRDIDEPLARLFLASDDIGSSSKLACQVLEHEELPAALLAEYAGERVPAEYRTAVAGNKSCPTESLRKMTTLVVKEWKKIRVAASAGKPASEEKNEAEEKSKYDALETLLPLVSLMPLLVALAGNPSNRPGSLVLIKTLIRKTVPRAFDDVWYVRLGFLFRKKPTEAEKMFIQGAKAIRATAEKNPAYPRGISLRFHRLIAGMRI